MRRAALALFFGWTLLGCVQPGQLNEEADGASEGSTVVSEVVDRDTFADPLDQGDPGVEDVDETPIRLSPVDLAFGAITDPTQLSEALESYERDWAEYVTVCTRQEGFTEYRRDPEQAPTPAQLVGAYSSGSEAALSQYGYGVSLALRGAWETHVGTEVVDTTNDTLTLEEFMAGLPDDQRGPFIEALAVCKERANSEIERPEPTVVDYLQDEIISLREVAAAAPEVKAAQDQWAQCMFEAGHPFRNRDEIYSDLVQESQEVERFVIERLSAATPPKPDDVERFDQLIKPLMEIEARLVEEDITCSEASQWETTRRNTVWEAEQAWVDQNADRIALALAEE